MNNIKKKNNNKTEDSKEKGKDNQNFLADDLSESFNNLFQLSSMGEKPINIKLEVERKEIIFS